MSRYILIRRLRGPAFLLLVGVNALLAQAHILGWGESWPFYLILWGVLMLAERAALAAEGYPGYPNYPGTNSGTNDPAASYPAGQSAQPAGSAETALIPRRHTGFENDVNGGEQ
jgi:hypothetical protein